MCKYCDLKKYKYCSIELTRSDCIKLEIEYWKNKYYLVGLGEDGARIEIKYCPFCGSLLK